MPNEIAVVYERIAGAAGVVKTTRERAGEALTLCRRKVSSFHTLHGRFDALASAYDSLLPQIKTAYGHDAVDDAWTIANDGRTEVWHGAGLTARDAVTKARAAARSTVGWCERGMNAFGDGSGLFLRPVVSWLTELEAEVAKRRGVDLRASPSAGIKVLGELRSWADTTVREAALHSSAVRSCEASVEAAVGNVPATISSLGTNVSFVRSEFVRLSTACVQAEAGMSRILSL